MLESRDMMRSSQDETQETEPRAEAGRSKDGPRGRALLGTFEGGKEGTQGQDAEAENAAPED